MKKILACVAVCAITQVWAVSSYYTGSDNTTDSFSNPNLWSGRLAPSEDGSDQIDYLLARNRYVKTPGAQDDQVFHGKSLTVGEIGGAYGILVFQALAGNSVTTFDNDGLFLAYGALGCWNDGNPKPTIAGTVTVLLGMSVPFEIKMEKKNSVFTFAGKVEADSDKMLKVYNPSGLANTMVSFIGDLSDYRGVLSVADTQVHVSDLSAGTLLVNGAVILGSSNTDRMSVSNLSIAEGATLVVPAENQIGGTRNCSHLTVTGSMAIAGKVRVTLSPWNSGWSQGPTGQTEFPFLTVPVDSGVTSDDFECTFSAEPFVYPTYHVVERDNGDDTRTFLVRRRMYMQIEGDAHVFDPNDGTKFTWRLYDEGADCFSKASDSREYYTPFLERAAFAGHTFMMCADAGKMMRLKICAADLTMGDLRVQPPDEIYARNVYDDADEVTLRGGLWLATGGASGRVAFVIGGGSKSLEVASTIVGDADARMNGLDGTARMLTLSGDNAAWVGGMEVYSETANGNVFRVASNTALGGPLAAFRYDALILGANAILQPAVDGLLLGISTRGVYVNATRAVVDVPEGMTFGIDESVTFNGALAKTGEGTLQLGGTGRIASEAEDPRDSVLSVEAGAVQPLTTDCLAGIPLAFSNTGCLGFSPATDPSEGVETRGVVDPVLADGALLTARVLFSSEPQLGAGSVDVPVCTMTTAAKADAIRNRIKLLKPWKGFVAKLVEKSNGDGSVTFLANVSRTGLLLVVE